LQIQGGCAGDPLGEGGWVYCRPAYRYCVQEVELMGVGPGGGAFAGGDEAAGAEGVEGRAERGPCAVCCSFKGAGADG
jgi:hypothetical protein